MTSKNKLIVLCICFISLPLIFQIFIPQFFLVGWILTSIILCAVLLKEHQNIIKPLSDIASNIEIMSKGDFRFKFNSTNNYSGQTQEIYLQLDSLAKTIRELIGKIESEVKQLYSSGQKLELIAENSSSIATEVANTVEQLANGATEQVTDISACTDTIQVATNDSIKANEQVEHIDKIASEFVEIAQEGRKNLNDTLEKVSDIKNTSQEVSIQITTLGQVSKEIGEIVDLITGIAAQTDLLALNAAIEAARAGEEGKGFAVVADEVKKLAEESSQAAGQIKDMIEKIQDESNKAVLSTKLSLDKVDEGVESFGHIQSSFEKISTQAVIINDESDSIVKKINELVAKNNEVLNAMNSVASVTETNAAAAEEISASTQEHSAGTHEVEHHASNLLTLARNLTVGASIFKIDEKPEIFFWNKEFFTGIDQIDFEHYTIVNYVNSLYQQYIEKKSDADLLVTLKELGDFTTRHFANEEKMMQLNNYPQFDNHIIQHKKLLGDLASFIESLENRTAKIDDTFIDFLNNWLRVHILNQDMQYVPYIKN